MFDEIENAVKERMGLTKVFLDYDGTLVDLTSQPENAKPDQKLLDLLNDLKAEIPLFLVTGRDLDGIISFVGRGFNIIAMHGSRFIGENGQKWFVENFEIYEKKTAQLASKYSHLEREFPGLRVIDKKGGLQFHYYNVDRILVKELERVISKIREDGFEMYTGKYVYELRIEGMDKGKAILSHVSDRDSILFAGDDRTDEEAFRELSRHVTIKIGDGKSTARFRLDSPAQMKKLLSDLLKNRKEMFRKVL